MQLIIDGREYPLPVWSADLEIEATVHVFVIRLANELKAQNRWVKEFDHAGRDDLFRNCRAIKITTDDLLEIVARVKAPFADSVRSAQETHREAARELRDSGNDRGAAFDDAIAFWQTSMDAIDVLSAAGQFDASQFDDARIEELLARLAECAQEGDRIAAAEVMDELADEAARIESLI